MSQVSLTSLLKLRDDIDKLEDTMVNTLSKLRETRVKNELLIQHFNTDANVITSVDFHRTLKNN